MNNTSPALSNGQKNEQIVNNTSLSYQPCGLHTSYAPGLSSFIEQYNIWKCGHYVIILKQLSSDDCLLDLYI